MTTSPTRRRSIPGILVVAVLLSCCGKKEQAPQPVHTPPPSTAAPTTTLAPPAPTTVPTPPPVWRAARWGMTKAEVLAAFPGEAELLSQPAAFAQPQPGATVPAGSSDLAIPAYEADGVRFRVLFGFESSALNRVHLSALKPTAATCSDIEKLLTQKHQAPSQRTKTGGSLPGEEIVWTLPDQTIALSCAGMARLGFQTVWLDYLAPGAAPTKG